MMHINTRHAMVGFVFVLVAFGALIVYQPHLYFTDRYSWYVHMGDKYVQVYKLNKAEQYFNKAILLDSEQSKAYKQKFKLYFYSGDFHRANMMLMPLKEKDKRFYSLFMGAVKLRLGYANESIQYFQEYNGTEFLDEKNIGLAAAYHRLGDSRSYELYKTFTPKQIRVYEQLI